MNCDGLSVNQDLTFIRLVKPIQNPHQGCFSSPVFSKESMNFARFDFEVYVIIGDYTGKFFNNIPYFDRGDSVDGFSGHCRDSKTG
jgi:hypothetical protein